ncbi:MAG: hypothetical protein KAR40_17920 [Candidatus Sabulitectum sp.]|nr:hypothetical protein [Candidatus Sabulitectum sp.]
MTSREFAAKAIARFNKRITNEVFLTIQNDPDLIHDYLRTVSEHGLNNVNQTIGKYVKETYKLDNGDREDAPSCTLIQTHQKFE